jgi:hypothetical protein
MHRLPIFIVRILMGKMENLENHASQRCSRSDLAELKNAIARFSNTAVVKRGGSNSTRYASSLESLKSRRPEALKEAARLSPLPCPKTPPKPVPVPKPLARKSLFKRSTPTLPYPDTSYLKMNIEMN